MVEKPSIDEQAGEKEVKLLMERFSRKDRIDLLKAVKQRSIDLDKREYALKTRQEMFQKVLSSITQIIEKQNSKDKEKIDNLDNMLAQFKNTISEFDEKLTEEEETKLNKVIRSFKEIKAKKAALIVPEMDMKLVVKVFLALPARNTAAIMQNLDPKLAAQISHRMAEERKKKNLRKKGEELLGTEGGKGEK